MIYNFFHRKKTFYNVSTYKKLGMKKKYFSPVSSKDFKNVDVSLLNATSFRLHPNKTNIYKNSDEATKESILNFNNEGFVVLNRYLSDEKVNAINEEINDLLKTKKVKFRYGNKIMFAINKSKKLKEVGRDNQLMELLSALIGSEVELFQSINFLMGSEQKTHSDSIHMTTYPLGGLLGVWVALEDTDMNNGPLHYYPGSHKLPYYLNSDYDNEGNYYMIGDKDYTQYEKMLEEKIIEHKIEKKIFTAKKGDVLIWHANLMHGGEPHIDKERTRKSMVFHYFNMNCVCYHEITQRPSLIN
jgi:ectoine hydroxylase-related dioxygenase (phytanoyl-CoA dioxygenase family)